MSVFGAQPLDGQVVVGTGGAIASTLASVATSDWSLMLIGVPLSTVLAAFAGSILSLTFQAVATYRQALAVLLAGTAAGSYLAPVADHVFSLPAVLEKGTAFVIGLAVQVAIPAILARIKREGDK